MISSTSSPHVAVIGGGYAGFAAAVELARHGAKVSLFEAGQSLGGRARTVHTQGLALDNGQHLLLGAYHQLLRLVDLVHEGQAAPLQRWPMRWQAWQGMQMHCPPWPAPWHLLAGLLSARQFPWAARWAMVRAIESLKKSQFQVEAQLSVAAWLQQQRQPETLIRSFWEPLTLAALNTPVAVASAQLLARVVRDGLLGPSADSNMLVPTCTLSEMFPEPAARWLQAQGHKIWRGRRVQQWQCEGSMFLLEAQMFDGLVLAVAPHQLDKMQHDPGLAPSLALTQKLQYQPITSIYLRFASGLRLPAPFLALNTEAQLPATTRYAQWVFDRGQWMESDQGLWCVVISAEGAHEALDRAALLEAVLLELAPFTQGQRPTHSQIITEKRATFSAVAGVERPSRHTAWPRVRLAGDYVDGPYPATLEGAVQSGIAAAHDLALALGLKAPANAKPPRS